MDLTRKLPRWWSLPAMVILLAVNGACGRQPEQEVAASEPVASGDTAVPVASASRAYVDPQTGRLVAGPVDGEEALPDALQPERLSRFQDDLVAEPLPDGGLSVDLRGRFRTDAVAHLDADGNLQIECVDSDAGTGDEAGSVPTETSGDAAAVGDSDEN